MSSFTMTNGCKVHAHKLIVSTAKDMAREVYAGVMKNNSHYNNWKQACDIMAPKDVTLTPIQYEELFVNEYFPNLIEQARATLAGLLNEPIAQTLKDEIQDALIKDAPLRLGRIRAGAKVKVANVQRTLLGNTQNG